MKLNFLKWNVVLFKEIGGEGCVVVINVVSIFLVLYG